jgi:MFS family permease
MSNIKGVVRSHLRERPFDFYVAALLFLIGFYAVVSDSWPEELGNPVVSTIIYIVSLYYIVAGVVIMLSLGCNRKKHPVWALMSEMYGWMFVAAAALATVLTYCGSLVSGNVTNAPMALILLAVWLGLFISSTVRFADLFSVYRSLKG